MTYFLFLEGDFESVSLSGPLDSLFGDKFQEILLARRSHVNLGWAGAEDFCLNFAKTDKFNTKRFAEVDKIEKALEESYAVPADPLVSKLASERDNYPLLAYTYLVRRFIMCPRFCLICFKCVQLLRRTGLSFHSLNFVSLSSELSKRKS